MTAEAVAQVWRRSRRKGSELLVMLAIADYAHDDLTGAYPSVELLRQKTRLSERAIWLILRKLQDAGEIVVRPKAGRNDATVFDIVLGAEEVFDWRRGPAKIALPRVQRLQSEGAKIAADECKDGTFNNSQECKIVSARVQNRVRYRAHASDEKRTDKEPIREGDRSLSLSLPLPDSFVVTEAMATWAADRGLSPPQVAAETEKFVDHFRANGDRKKDWVAAWRNWMRRVDDFAPARRTGPPADHRPPAPPNGTVAQANRPTIRQPKMLYQTFDLDANDYVLLPEPIPDTDPRYAAEFAASQERLREAGRRERAKP